MNTDDPAYEELRARYGERIVAFDSQDPTTEVLAHRIFEVAAARLASQTSQAGARYALRQEVRLKKVRVWETATSWAEYEAD